MMIRSAPARTAGICLLAIAAIASPAFADRLHLESGGVVETDRWWIENDWIYYADIGGTMGLPRNAVVRIESVETQAENLDSTAGELPEALLEKQQLPDPRRDKRIRTLLESGRDHLEQGRYEEASTAFGQVLTDSNSHLDGAIGFALAESALGRDGSATSVVLDGLTQHPKSADLHELLGNLRNREERIRDAMEEWRTAFRLAPSDRLRDKIEKGHRELLAADNYDFSRSSHFNVRYDGTLDQALAGDVVDYLEDRHYELATAFRHTPNQPITLLLYPGQEFRDVTRSPDWVGGLFDGKIRVPLGGLSKLHSPAKRVLTHELTHAIVHSKSHGHCPWWLHEGLAQRMEGRRVDPARLAELLQAEPSRNLDSHADAALSYLAALSFTEYLEKRSGFANLVWLLDEIGAGHDLEASLEKVFGGGWTRLQIDWRESLVPAGSSR